MIGGRHSSDVLREVQLFAYFALTPSTVPLLMLARNNLSSRRPNLIATGNNRLTYVFVLRNTVSGFQVVLRVLCERVG